MAIADGAVSGAAAGSSLGPYGALAGAAIGAIGGWLGQRSANKANKDIAQQQMAFQASQTGTAWQRGVADMQAAGLSPMLAYSQGPAQSAQGASATMQSAGPALQKGIDQVIQTAQLENATNATNADVRLKAAQETGISAEVQLKHLQGLLSAQQGATSAAEEARIREEIKQIIASTHSTKLNNDFLSQSLGDRLVGVKLGNKYTEANTAKSAEETKGKKQQREFDYSLIPSRQRQQIADEGSSIINMVRGNLGLNRAQSESNAWGSDYGQKYRPYLGDAATGLNSAANAARALRYGW